ncbi:MAG: YigZ family protein [candidate division Zixibacteria bacterium]|nr:YigZ family protein [candidate division Zixibacteria bacterium]
METPDSYLTIKGNAETEIKIKASKFIGRVFSCESENEAITVLENIRKKYYDATHHCFAYRVGLGKDIIFRYSDDGEPNGTAGKPIYDRLEGPDLTNLILIVTRYYGGTKLGTGGLTHAYSDTAKAVLDKAGSLEKYITDNISMVLQFSDYSNVERTIHQIGAKIIESDFSDIVKLTVKTRLSLIEKLKSNLIDLTSGRIKID